MPTISYRQTDTTSACAWLVFCSGLAQSTGPLHANVRAAYGATPGSANFTLTLSASETTVLGWYFELAITNGENWLAGTWTVRLNIATANANVTWTNIDICRVSSGCVNQASIGSASGLGISLGSTGVKTATVTGSAQTPSANDKIIILLGFTNSAASSQSVGIIDDQLIDSPFTVPTLGLQSSTVAKPLMYVQRW